MTRTPDPDMAPLVRQIWQTIAATPDIAGGHRIAMPPVVERECAPEEGRFSDAFPVLDHLGAALALARDHGPRALAEAIARAAPQFRWTQNAGYTEANCTRTFLDGYAYAALAGPDMALSWTVPRTGVFLLGPHVHYPGHNHAPREVYLVLTPGTRWRLEEGDWFEMRPGDVVFHDHWVMHAMHTGADPLLAVTAWLDEGDRMAIGWGRDVTAPPV